MINFHNADLIDFRNQRKQILAGGYGEIGRRKGLKIPRGRLRAGSSPATRIYLQKPGFSDPFLGMTEDNMVLRKYMKKNLCVALAAFTVLAACGRPDDFKPSEIESDPIGTEVVEKPTDGESNNGPGLMAIGERYEKDGKIESYLTGEWIDKDIATRRPLAVMIPNNRNALPQYGISCADVVYEAPMEKCACTRLMGIFQNYGDLEYIEPVRSSRQYFLMESLCYDAIYCNWGLAVPYVGPLINSDLVDNVSASVQGIDVGADEAYARDKERQNQGYSLEYTGYLTLEGYEAAVDRLGYDTKYPTKNYTYPLQFATDAHKAEYEGYPSSSKIYPGGNKNQSGANGYSELNPYFEYNKEDGLYYRFQNDKPHMDEYNGKQVAVTNLIVQFVDGKVLDDSGYMSFDICGTGEGVLFTNGKAVEITWVKSYPVDSDLNYTEGVYEQTKYYEQSTGDELILNKGKTWVCLVWDKYKESTSY